MSTVKELMKEKGLDKIIELRGEDKDPIKIDGEKMTINTKNLDSKALYLVKYMGKDKVIRVCAELCTEIYSFTEENDN